jgi:uncharacterized protein (TIGR03000 family)
MTVTRLVGVAFAVAVATSSAVAQPRLSRGPLFDRPALTGPGPGWRDKQELAAAVDASAGQPWSYYGLSSGPRTSVGIGVWPGQFGFGGWPAAGGGFWTNGLSLYGPPVPTYGPVPGTFGGGDAHRFYSNPPLFGFGLNYFGYRSPSPRLANPTVNVYPPGQEPPPHRLFRSPPSNARCARVEVALPHPDADIWLNATAMKGTGTERAFESPELEAGKTYQYEVVARWRQDGREKAEARTLTVAPGQTVLADFTRAK